MNSVGPLAGLRVLEFVGLGPGPFAGMMLADLGATVLRIDRLSDAQRESRAHPPRGPLHRGKGSIAVDLKHAAAPELVLHLVERADAVIDVWRPGVAERLGIGPDECLERNPRIIYGRLTGWGQEGPWASMAGHDIDYIALAGALEPLGRAGAPPTPPINVLGDFAGGGMLLAFGIVCAAWEAARSGQGQVIDAAMIDGAALMMAPFYTARSSGLWGPRGTNMLDTGAPFYEVYGTADDRWVAVGAIEPQFYAALLDGLGLTDDPLFASQHDRALWAAQKARLASVFESRTRDEWCAIFDHTDACVAPVLDPVEAPAHPHHAARATFIDGQPAAAPRFSRTPAGPPGPAHHAGEGADLSEWGIERDEEATLRAAGAIW
ncbi:MAG TPA: CaiB/BaiF CoA-transferase family protein [Acidimicrobiales bacterium]|nr:CaiB/BaiF CoA-transferase family protein [Acidimicrobiales bacterium]